MVPSSADEKSILAELQAEGLNVSENIQQQIECLALTGQAKNCRIGLPNSAFLSSTQPRAIFWSPGGFPIGSSVSVSSSRLSRKLDQYPDWFDALRTLGVQLSQQDSEDRFLISAKGTTTDRFLNRISNLFRIPMITFEEMPAKLSPDWIKSHQQAVHTIFYIPLNPINKDSLLSTISQQAIFLSVKKKGNTRQAIESRLDLNAPAGTTRLLVNHSLTPHKVETELINAGATGWWLYANSNQTSGVNSPSVSPNIDTAILSLEEIQQDQFLLHWTRRRVGAWPDQSETEFVDDLIFQSERRQHSERHSLCRILASRKIYATNELTRSSRPVVCLSAVPIKQLMKHRTFRSHLSRWDFEPYGIAISKDYLKGIGVQPVVYGDQADWDNMTDIQRPFFQRQQTANQKIDWKAESEWRIIGDLNLERIPADQAFVFVRNQADATVISRLSNWPIVVLQ